MDEMLMYCWNSSWSLMKISSALKSSYAGLTALLGTWGCPIVGLKDAELGIEPPRSERLEMLIFALNTRMRVVPTPASVVQSARLLWSTPAWGTNSVVVLGMAVLGHRGKARQIANDLPDSPAMFWNWVGCYLWVSRSSASSSWEQTALG